MNRFVRLVKENVIPSIIFSILVVSCAGAWYLLHPASPHHDRYSFVVAYDAIGTLSPGNPVEVRGIKVGEITKVELTEDAVYVTARVLSTTRIPDNSEYRLINSGLMGEREMCILTGDSPDMIHDGDTLKGHYDEGTSGVVKSLLAAVDDLEDVMDTLNSFIDTLTVGSTGQRIKRIITKGKKLVKVSKADVKSWLGEAETVIDDLTGALEKTKSTLNDAVAKGEAKVDDVKVLMDRADALLKQLDGMKGQSEKLLSQLSEQNNSAGLILAENGEFVKKIDKLARSADALIVDIKKHGLKLNVDIF